MRLQRMMGLPNQWRSILAMGLVVLFVGMTGIEVDPAHATTEPETSAPFDETSDVEESRDTSSDSTPGPSQSVTQPSEDPGASVKPKADDDTLDEPQAQAQREDAAADMGAAAPLALDSRDCSYADPDTGAYAQTLCWLDFTGFTTQYRDRGASAGSPRYVSMLDPDGGPYVHTVSDTSNNVGGNRWGHVQNVDVEVDLGGGFTLTAQLDANASGATTAKAVESHTFPTWGNAFLGNTLSGNSFYTGVSGQPALYQALNGAGSTTLTLKDIRVFEGSQEVRDYSIVVADAETTDSGEGISWTTTGAGFTWLPNTPPGTTKSQVMGNACTSAAPGWNSSTPSRTASCSANTSSSKNGTPMLATAPPASQATQFNITQTLTGNGKQGVSFGVIMARAAVEVTVTDRIVNESNEPNDTTNFSATVHQNVGSTLLGAAETGQTLLSSGEISQVLPVSSSGTRLRFASNAQGELAESYTAAWQCEKTDPVTGDTRYWPSATTTSPTPPPAAHEFALLSVGQFLKCEVEYSPPYLSLLKVVDNGETDATNTAADFTLTGARSTAPNSTITGPGNGAETVTRRPIAVGQYELSEESPDIEEAANWQYGYDWTDLQCAVTPNSGSTKRGAFDTTRNESEIITTGTLQVLRGNDITCTYANTAREPQLDATKEAFDASGDPLDWGTPVHAGDTVRYQLTFDNAGTASMELDHIDYLGDVLDDATFITESLRIADGQEAGYPAESIANPGVEVAEQLSGDNPLLEITGTVERGQTRTVWFEVTVLDNAENADARQDDTPRTSDDMPDRVGYALNNYLVAAGDSVPETCAEPEDDSSETCTHDPVPAWSLDKNSRPADGARLHKGGNTHYQITATKMNTATDVHELVFADDLTHVFKTAGWAPGAAVPGGALTRGIYFFDADDQSLDEEGNPIGTVDEPQPAYDENSGYVPEPTYDETTERWTLTSQPVDLPTNAMRAEMWFAVEAGQSPAGIPTEWTGSDTPQMGWQYTNYVTAHADDVAPNQCATGDTPTPNIGLAPNENPANDTDFPEACQVTHQLSENYFTIRKDAAGTGLEPAPAEGAWGDTTGLTNMVGHEFEIRDDLNGEPSSYPSEKLCREEYNPASGWDGNFITAGTPDWQEHSETLAAIIEYNNLQDSEAEQLPLCGLIYPQGTHGGQPHAGGQDGRWRSEYLSEGNYWLVETKAPDQQIDTTGTLDREVSGVQLLAEPIHFRIWPDEPAPPFGEQDPPQSMHGQGQLDVMGEEHRCSPGAPVGERPVACVNPTGYLMLVKDAAPMKLPLTGGQWAAWLTGVGLVLLMVSLAGAWWWRSRRSSSPSANDRATSTE